MIIKIGLRDAGPITLAGLRYVLGFVTFLPVFPFLSPVRRLPGGGARAWLGLAGAGILAYPVANGLLYPALGHLDVTAASFVFNQSPVFVLLLGIVLLAERPAPLQLLGFGVLTGGICLFFGVPAPGRDPLWLLAAVGAAAAFAGYNVLARHLTRSGQLGTVVLVAWPLAIGGSMMLAIGLLTERPPRFSWTLGGIVAWLAVVNTSLAYAAWSRALRHLRAFEANVFLGLTPMVTALIAWALLGQRPSAIQFAAMALATAGVVLVQAAAARGRDQLGP